MNVLKAINPITMINLRKPNQNPQKDPKDLQASLEGAKKVRFFPREKTMESSQHSQQQPQQPESPDPDETSRLTPTKIDKGSDETSEIIVTNKEDNHLENPDYIETQQVMATDDTINSNEEPTVTETQIQSNEVGDVDLCLISWTATLHHDKRNSFPHISTKLFPHVLHIVKKCRSVQMKQKEYFFYNFN